MPFCAAWAFRDGALGNWQVVALDGGVKHEHLKLTKR
jgi:hypothetical protein